MHAVETWTEVRVTRLNLYIEDKDYFLILIYILFYKTFHFSKIDSHFLNHEGGFAIFRFMVGI